MFKDPTVTTIFDKETKEYVVCIGEEVYKFDSYIAYKGFWEAVIMHAHRQAKTKH